jgi:Protein of unknown function (DUF3016)
MRQIARLASLASLLVTLTSAAAWAADAPVTVTFAHPEKYTDLRLSCVSRDTDARSLMADLEAFLTATAAPLVPAGQRLEITVTNVDMAGDIESWRGPGRCDVRVMKDTYPPRIDLTFRLLDGEGKEIRAGTRRLRDSNYLVNAGPSSSIDHLRYEKALLGDWVRRELGRGTRS